MPYFVCIIEMYMTKNVYNIFFILFIVYIKLVYLYLHILIYIYIYIYLFIYRKVLWPIFRDSDLDIATSI